MSDEMYEINVNYEDGRKPTRYKAKEENGITFIYGFHSDWKGWRLVAIRFDKLRFKTAEAVEAYLNNNMKARIIQQINDGVWNSRIQSELMVLLSISKAELKNANIPKRLWEY